MSQVYPLRRLALFLACLGVAAVASAQAPPNLRFDPVPASSRPSIALDAEAPAAAAEQWERGMDQVTVRNVTRAALYPVLPRKGKANGRAVLIAPGGGYRFVSMDSEGFRVADRLAQAGYAAFVLKYRTVTTPRESEANLRELASLFGNLGKTELADHDPAVEDLAMALKLVADRAAQWQVDPTQIHVIGFSAGARTSIRLLEKRAEAARARTVALMYPPMTQTVSGGPRPPLFLAIAADDPLFKQGGLNLVAEWLKQSPNVEFHLYSGGSHGFGMRPQGTTSDRWIDHYSSWLAQQP